MNQNKFILAFKIKETIQKSLIIFIIFLLEQKVIKINVNYEM